jgi:3-phosphoshikimate 1-carboxyvinyltransferase
MRRVTEPLARMGARIGTTEGGTAPLDLTPVDRLTGLDYVMPVASAQVKSSLLLAGLYAEGETCVTEPAPTRDHTERMLTAFGYSVRRHAAKVCLTGGGRLTGCRLTIPADISSAAFFLVGASIAPGSDLILEGVGINPTRVGVINILRAMGGDIELIDRRTAGGEPVADIRVRHARLRGIRIPVDQVPLAIDELPVLFIAAACAEGETILTGAEELRVKESDRIQVMADGLAKLGVCAEPLAGRDAHPRRGAGLDGRSGCGRCARDRCAHDRCARRPSDRHVLRHRGLAGERPDRDPGLRQRRDLLPRIRRAGRNRRLEHPATRG